MSRVRIASPALEDKKIQETGIQDTGKYIQKVLDILLMMVEST
ncbi:hypothetical protein QUA30_12730 [Microcoleus sp. Pol14C2]